MGWKRGWQDCRGPVKSHGGLATAIDSSLRRDAAMEDSGPTPRDGQNVIPQVDVRGANGQLRWIRMAKLEGSKQMSGGGQDLQILESSPGPNNRWSRQSVCAVSVPETEKHRPEERNKAINEGGMMGCGVRVESSAGRSGQCWLWRGVHCGRCCHQLVLKEKLDGGSEGGRTPASQSVNQSVNKQIARLLDSGRVEGRDRPRAGWMLRAQVLAACARAHAQAPRCSCRPSGELVAGQGRAAWRGPGPGSWQTQSRAWSPGCRFCLPQQTLTLELGAFYLDDHPPASPHHLALDDSILHMGMLLVPKCLCL